MSGESERLLARIKNIRQALPAADVVNRLRQSPAGEPAPASLEDLQKRVTYIEQLVQGLQDSVYRETQRQDRHLAELEARLDPGALAAALGQAARDQQP
ncbi:MAG TPA: hypothetical protein VHW04_10915 [Solirubrobacteraceae bacterium]|jgi:hypothetical protein|nr:hypothetical protein [Solirubrobacteraceae bacterium]